LYEVVPRLDLTGVWNAGVLDGSVIINGPDSREQANTPCVPNAYRIS
jgi:hypothetical protein